NSTSAHRDMLGLLLRVCGCTLKRAASLSIHSIRRGGGGGHFSAGKGQFPGLFDVTDIAVAAATAGRFCNAAFISRSSSVQATCWTAHVSLTNGTLALLGQQPRIDAADMELVSAGGQFDWLTLLELLQAYDALGSEAFAAQVRSTGQR